MAAQADPSQILAQAKANIRAYFTTHKPRLEALTDEFNAHFDVVQQRNPRIPTAAEVTKYQNLVGSMFRIYRELLEAQYARENRWFFYNGGERPFSVPELREQYMKFEAFFVDISAAFNHAITKWARVGQQSNGLNLEAAKALTPPRTSFLDDD